VSASAYRQVRALITAASQAAGRPEPQLIAVSKGQPARAIAELYRLGHRDFGENYVQELLKKQRELIALGCSDIRWHFIGHLQTNKVKSVLPAVCAIHSVDSLKLVQEISKRATRVVSIFIEINIDQQSTKSGVLPEQAQALAEAASLLPSLVTLGLMCVPAANASPEALRKSFSRMRELSAQLGRNVYGSLSMGMSRDFEIAIAEGATHIRIGTALFGARAPKKP